MSSPRNLTRRQFLQLSMSVAGGTLLVAACTPKAAPQPAATKAPTEVEAKPEPTTAPTTVPPTVEAKPFKFSYLRPVWGPATHQKGSDYELELFRRANVEIEAQIVPVFDYETKLPVLVAGGTMADVMWHAGPQWGPAHDLIEQGAFLPLNEYLGRYPAVRDAIGETLWTLTRSPDGNNYFFPNPLAPYVPFPISYRTDIYDKLGLKEPESIDEFVEQLRTIRHELPDMIPLTAHEYSVWYFQNVGVSFGYPWGNWVPDEGQPQDNPARIVPGNVTRNYREFLGFLQSLRKENLIDPDYMVTTGLKGIDKFRGGSAVTMAGHWGALPDDNSELRKSVPEGDISYMKQLQGPDRPMGALTLSGFDRGFSISSRSKDRIDGIFEFLDWAYTDGYDFMKYGVEGETYTVEEDGTKVSIPDTERKPGYQRPNVEPFGFPPKTEDTWPRWSELRKVYADRGVEDKLPATVEMYTVAAANAMPNWNHLTFSPTAGEKGSQLWQQYLKPMEDKLVIDPDLPLTTWDENVELWLENGGQKIIEEVNEIQKDKSPIKPKYELPPDFEL